MMFETVRQSCAVRPGSYAALGALLVLALARPSLGAPQEPPAVALATDQTSVTLSDTFFAKNAFGLKTNGDVIFGTSGTVLFEWSATTGTKTRLLQVNDPIPGHPGSVAVAVGPSTQLNTAGHLALTISWAAPGARNPAGVFVYDGSQYLNVASSGEAVPGVAGSVFAAFKGVRTNASDQVAFVAQFEPAAENMLGVFLGSPSGPPVKIATVADLRPLLGGNHADNIYLIGVDSAGHVAFLCEDVMMPYNYAVVVGEPSGALHVIRSSDVAPGTTSGQFQLPSSTGNYWFNANGDLAFFANVWNDPSVYGGIWVRSASGSLQKLAVTGEATGTALGGTYNSFTFRAMNDSGQVLYTGGVNSGTSSQALFLKAVGGAADVLCYKNQAIAGGSQTVNNIGSAALNTGVEAAVVATFANPIGGGLLLCSASGSPQLIAAQGSATPAGGTYAGLGSARINAANQIVFRSDISTLNANGLFFWAPGGPVRAIVSTADTIMPGANKALLDYGAIASDDEALFWPYAGEGKDTIFTRSLHAGGAIRRIVGDGDAAPGGGAIAYIDRPVINDQEELVVFSSVIGGPVYPEDAFWLSKPGAALQKLAMTNDAAPGSAGGQFSGFPGPARINNNSEVAFYANVKGSSGNASPAGVFFVSSSGTVSKIARVGDSSPAGGTFQVFSSTVYLGDSGQVAFRATSGNGTTQTDGLFIGSASGAPVKLMAVGDAWGAGTFSGLGYNFRMNRAGQVAFWADLSYNSGGIFVASGGAAPAAIALSDDNTPIPGNFVTLTFPDVYLDINTSGQVAFWGVYFTDTLGSYETAFFVGSATSAPVPRLTQGQALPGGGTCPIFVPRADGFALADSGELAMYVPGSPDTGVLPRYVIAGADGTLRPFAAVGTNAVGTGSAFGKLGSVGVNSAGAFFLNAILVGGPAREGVFRNGSLATPLTIFRPSASEWWTRGETSAVTFGQAGDIPVPADYDGNGTPDLAVFRPSTGEWIIKDQRTVAFGQTGDVPVPGDYNGDGKAELAVFRPATGEWVIEGLEAPTHWGMKGDVPAPADYNGDGIVEIAVFRPTTGVWYVMGGVTLAWGMWGDVPVAADYNGDGKAEIAVYRPSTGWWYVALGPMAAWGAPGDVPVPLDVDGDGRVEFVVFRASDGKWYALNPTTSQTMSADLGSTGDVPVGQAPQLPVSPIPETPGDFDHDGVADVTVFRPSNGGWYSLESTHAYRTVAGVMLGQSGDVPVPGDYQGNGYQERAVYRPSTGQWLLEDGRTLTLGASDDVPAPGDYDGDGVTDIAVFTPGTGLWSILTGASGFTTLVTELWGAPGDVPAPGDYDGDGKTDCAVFTPATGQWSIRSSLTGTALLTVAFGMTGDIPVSGDYDGDGKTDIAVYRPGTGYWYVLTSSSTWTNYLAYWWGAVGDVPVPGDFDGDGVTDVAVYRPATGTWYVMNVLTITGWGESGDVPVLSRK